MTFFNNDKKAAWFDSFLIVSLEFWVVHSILLAVFFQDSMLHLKMNMRCLLRYYQSLTLLHIYCWLIEFKQQQKNLILSFSYWIKFNDHELANKISWHDKTMYGCTDPPLLITTLLSLSICHCWPPPPANAILR